MSTATRTIQPPGKALYELLSSMRFAVSLLTVIAIASIIGTVLKQGQPYSDYVFQFGTFWFDVFRILGLYDVYHAGWFLVILAFLVVSTSLCIYRNSPNMVREMRSFREHATDKSLAAFHHRREYVSDLSVATLAQRFEAYLKARRWHLKTRPTEDGGLLIAAKSGSLSRLGYIFAHSAIVLICIGGLIDGNLIFKAQQLLGIKKIETRDIPENQVPAASRLSTSNPSFRGNVTIPEGGSANVVFINVGDGYLVQDLPFILALRRFHIEHYPTGQPKAFDSDISIYSPDGKLIKNATVSVNHPLTYDGIAIYQASFGDGGSKLALKAWDLFTPKDQALDMTGVVHSHTELKTDMGNYRVEFTTFRPFNVEAMGKGPPPLTLKNMQVLGGNPTQGGEGMQNVGPSFEYKLRDAQGQAREYSNFMLPIQIEGRWYMMSGMRTAPNQPFRYVRFPLGPNDTLASFMRLRAAFLNPQLRTEAAQRFAATALGGGAANADMRTKLAESTAKMLDIFSQGGFQALGQFIQTKVPKEQQDKAAETYLKVLELASYSLLQLADEQAGEKPPPPGAVAGWFIRDSLNAYSDLFIYGAPVYLQLTHYDQVQSSGFQLTRAPGKNVVYLGSLLLVIGIALMLFVRERRMWVRLRPGGVLLAMSAAKKTIDFEREFAEHSASAEKLVKD